MKLEEVKSVSDLERYLREFKGWGDDEDVYDFGSVVALFLAVMENIGYYGEGDIDEIGFRMTDPQRALLSRIAAAASSVTDEEIEKE